MGLFIRPVGRDVRSRLAQFHENLSIQVVADPERMKQVFRNLIGNAVKFSPHNSAVRIDARPVEETVLISVKDEGPGVPVDELETIFDKFIQSTKTKSGGGGTGLGLAISRKIALGHLGRVWAENRSKKGAVFYCQFPLLANIAETAAIS